MKQINTLIPFLETDFHEVFNYVTSKGTPTCLYTYETCNACYSPNASLYVRYEESIHSDQYPYCLIKQVVTELYGSGKMDNKITLRYLIDMWDVDYEHYDVPIYITYWDGRISISTDVYFFRDIEGANSYRVVPYAKGVNGDLKAWEDYEKENRKMIWHRGADGGLYEDFEQSIGE